MGSARGASGRRDPATRSAHVLPAPGSVTGRRATMPEQQGFSDAEQSAMLRALDIARTPGVPRGPNPRVGCVLLDADGREVAEGFHRGAGHPHAEIEALRALGGTASGLTAVVTPEPCNHTGRTAPCSQALVEAGVSRVVFGQADSNPVAAGGATALHAAGVDVAGGLMEDEARAGHPALAVAA